MPLEYTSSNQRIAVVIKATQMVIVRAPLLRCYSSLRVEQKRTQSNPSLSCAAYCPLPWTMQAQNLVKRRRAQTTTLVRGSHRQPYARQFVPNLGQRTARLAAEQRQTEQAHHVGETAQIPPRPFFLKDAAPFPYHPPNTLCATLPPWALRYATLQPNPARRQPAVLRPSS